ncbi:MAG: hypothetical protein H0X51_02455 [Parachlamydiaceae bacterium]|nr:hypothetical protein [Parachlamydiaceae bacterium]
MFWKVVFLITLVAFSPALEGLAPNQEQLNKTVTSLIRNFGDQQEKKYNLVFLTHCTGVSILDCPEVIWAFNYRTDKKLKLEEARQLAVAMIDDYWQYFSKNPFFENYLKASFATISWMPKDVTPKRIGFKIAFWDDQVDRYPPPYISQIRVKDGIIQYFQREPNSPALQKPFEETFEQAFAIYNASVEKRTERTKDANDEKDVKDK